MRASAGQGRRGRDFPGQRYCHQRGPWRTRGRRGAPRSRRPSGPAGRGCASSAPGTDRYGGDVTVDRRGNLAFPGRVVVRSDRGLAARRRDQDPARPGRRAHADRGGAAVRAGGPVDQAAAGRNPPGRGPHGAQRARQAAARPQHAALGPARGGAGAADRGRPGRVPAARHGDQVRVAPGAGRAAARAVRVLVRVLPPLRGRAVRPDGPPGADLGDAAHRRPQARGDRRDGVRRRLPAARAPDRDHVPQGAEQHPGGQAGRSRLAVGDRRPRGRPRRHPPRPRHVRGLRRVRRPGQEARPRGGDRPGAECLARPSRG